MMSKFIELPDEQEIDLYTLVDRMSKAVYPLSDDATGVDCVVGGTVGLPDKDDPPMPYVITSEEKAKLVPLLGQLPPLHGKMSPQEKNDFLEKYADLPNKLWWTPTLYTDADLFRVIHDRGDVCRQYFERINQEISSGGMQIFDKNFVPLSKLTYSGLTFITKERAIDFVKSFGIQIRQPANNVTSDSALSNGTRAESILYTAHARSRETDVSENDQTITGREPESSKPISKKNPKWTDELKLRIYRRLLELKRSGIRNFAVLTAKEFSISTVRLSQLLTVEKKAEFDKIIEGQANKKKVKKAKNPDQGGPFGVLHREQLTKR